METKSKKKERHLEGALAVSGVLVFETTSEMAELPADEAIWAAITVAESSKPWIAIGEGGHEVREKQWLATESRRVPTKSGFACIVKKSVANVIPVQKIGAYRRYVEEIASAISLAGLPGLDRVYGMILCHSAAACYVSESGVRAKGDNDLLLASDDVLGLLTDA